MWSTKIEAAQARIIPLKVLAHLGDAVFHLYERERLALTSPSVKALHQVTAKRVEASKQAEMLDLIQESLTEEELEIVRRARNVKPSNYRRAGQDAYRKSTAFEALLGYLYLTDEKRLLNILQKTLSSP